MPALLRVRYVFGPTKKGPVLVADVLDGEVGIGMHLGMSGRIEPLVISAMDFVDWRATGDPAVSLRLHFRDAPTVEEVRAAFPEGSRVAVRQPSEPAARRGATTIPSPVAGG